MLLFILFLYKLMLYQKFYDIFSDKIDSLIYDLVSKKMKELGDLSLDKKKIVDIFTGFDFIPIIEKINQKFYTEKEMRNLLKQKKFLRRKKFYFVYKYYPNQLRFVALEILLLRHENYNYQVIYKFYKELLDFEELSLKKYSLFSNEVKRVIFNTNFIKVLEEVWKILYSPAILFYLFDIESMKFVKRFLSNFLKAINIIKNYKEFDGFFENIPFDIGDVFRKLYSLLPDYNDYSITYLEYINIQNNQNEIFFRKKIINKLISLFFIDLFFRLFDLIPKYVNSGLESVYSFDNVFDRYDPDEIRSSDKDFAYAKKVDKYVPFFRLKNNNLFLLAPYDWAFKLKELHEYIDYFLKGYSGIYDLKVFYFDTLVYDFFSYVVVYFYDYLNYLLSFSEINEFVKKFCANNHVSFDLFTKFESLFSKFVFDFGYKREEKYKGLIARVMYYLLRKERKLPNPLELFVGSRDFFSLEPIKLFLKKRGQIGLSRWVLKTKLLANLNIFSSNWKQQLLIRKPNESKKAIRIF
ncbi:MAG: hypothetical protein RMJ17_00125 [Candidatus Aenigmarchaeota archaeon]|nr:hypothetical protein [Candidatus Aenigmarchaeota archaeon]MDW8148998.1 hypothetical protein [Candidatus Aenigmarchaeota archaeon]